MQKRTLTITIILLLLISCLAIFGYVPAVHATSVTLHPTGDGTLSQCRIYPASPTSHYDKVDEETPNDATDYVNAGGYEGETLQDSYTKPPCGIPAGSTINSVIIYTRIYTPKVDLTYGWVKSLLRSGSTNYLGAFYQAAAWATKSDTYALSPFTGVSWTITEIDAMQIGQQCSSVTTPYENVANAYCSTVWIVVDYTPPVAGNNYVVDTAFSSSVSFSKSVKTAFQVTSSFSPSISYANLLSRMFNLVTSFSSTNAFGTNMFGVTIDYFDESHYTGVYQLDEFYPNGDNSALSQSFTTLATPYNITSVKFFLAKYGNPTGMAHAALYAHSGTYGVSSIPTGSPLATSGDFDVSTLQAPVDIDLYTFTFNSSQQYQMAANTHYAIVYQNPTSGVMNSTNYIDVGCGSGHSGNLALYFGSYSYWNVETQDMIFYVYGTSDKTLLINVAYHLLFSFVSNTAFLLSVLSSAVARYIIDLVFSSASAFVTIVNTAFKITSGFSSNPILSTLLNSAFHVDSSFVTSTSISALLQAAYQIAAGFSTSSSFLLDVLYTHIGLQYIVDLTFTSVSSFVAFLNSAFNVNTDFFTSVSFMIPAWLAGHLLTYIVIGIVAMILVAFAFVITRRIRL